MGLEFLGNKSDLSGHSFVADTAHQHRRVGFDVQCGVVLKGRPQQPSAEKREFNRANRLLNDVLIFQRGSALTGILR